MIRLGYHCSFLDSDTIRFIMSAVVAHHDRSRFTVYGYSYTEVAADIAGSFDVVRVTRDLSDEQFAALVREDRIDILVELSGFSPHHRFAALAQRCAPIQINYLNHSATSGVPNVDYLLVDERTVPPEHDRFYTERVWRLPDCFLCYNYDMLPLAPIAPPPYKANGFVTFGCFGSGGKINPALIEIWARLLARVPGSHLFVRNSELTPADNQRFMRSQFAAHGIAPERIRLAGSAPRSEFVKSYADVDISLDTWPYCGGNTVAESLFEGVPVVTLRGDRFSSRYGASLLIAAGCPELVAESADGYVAIAADLAASPARLDAYRANLRDMMRTHGLSDAAAFARKLEDAYVAMRGVAGA